jgi:hypothetical protein
MATDLVLAARTARVVVFLSVQITLAAVLLLAAIPTKPAAAACTEPPSDMIAWWPGDNSTDDIQGDNDGTLQNGAGYGAGKVGAAFSFGSGSYVDVPNGPAWALGTSDFTIDLWANFTTVQGRDPFISHDLAAGNADKWIFWYDATGHRAPAGPALRFHINGPTLGAIDTVAYSWSPTTGQWYHLAVTRSGSTYKLYIDGVMVIQEIDANAIQDAGVPLQIGAAESFKFNGGIDEVEVFNRALSDAEILALFTADSEGKCKDLNDCIQEGDPCDDGNDCTLEDVCTSGLCTGAPKCLAPDDCHDDGTCNPFTAVCTNPEKADGTACDDADSCTFEDACTDGTCAGEMSEICAPPCPATPVSSGCALGESQAGKLSVKDKEGTAKDQVKFGWKKNLVELSTPSLGDPLTDTGYTLCVYDYAADVPALRISARVGPGGTCGTKPCWKANGPLTAFKYGDKTGASEGITKVQLKSGVAGKAKAAVQAKGGSLVLPPPATLEKFFNQDTLVRAQLFNSLGTCVEATYSAASSKQKVGSFKGKND